MSNFQNLLMGFGTVFTLQRLAVCVLGAVLGLIVGVPFVPFVIGAVGFSQVIGLMMERYNGVEMPKDKLTLRGSLLSKEQFKRLVPPAVRSGVAGTFIGVLPGSGATTASFLGYAMQKGFKSKEPLGTGAIEGVAACESANNAAAAGSFAPLLALGIPGSGTGAVLLGGLMMWGLNPGPLLFTNNAEFAWGLIASLFVANIVALVIAMSIIPHLVKILAVDKQLLFKGEHTPYNSFQEVLDAIAAGTSVTIGGSKGDDIATYQALAAELGVSETQLPYITYDGTGDAITALLGGHVDLLISKPAAASEYVEAGSIQAILALSTERYGGKLADAPTLSEVGDYKDVEVPVWRGVAAPGAMSDEAAAFWSGILKQVSESEQWKAEYLDKNMLISNYMDLATTQAYMAQYQADYLASIGK